MTARTIIICNGLTSKCRIAAIALVSLIAPPTAGVAQAPSDSGTTSIQRGSETDKARKAEEPSYQTREERLRAKPLDWNSTVGKSKPSAHAAAKKKATGKARPGSAEGGAPNPKAKEEARKLHPEDWK